MSRILTPVQTYQLFNVLKLAFNNKFNINERGVVYFKKFGEQSFNKSYLKFQMIKWNKEFPHEEDLKILFASNLVRDPSTDAFKFNPDFRHNLIRYKSSLTYYKDETIELFKKYTFSDLLNNDALILKLLGTGEITPEWFVLTSRVLPVTKLLDESNPFMWSVLKDRLTTYKFFVTIKNVEQLNDLKRFLTNHIFST